MSFHRDAYISRDKTPNEVCIPDEATRKRKLDEIDGNESEVAIDTRPFSIRADSSNPFAKPRIFKPQCLLDRSRLPLAFLDTAQDGSRLFKAHVHILEACHEHRGDAHVLIVEDEEERRLYAVERTQRRQYALCRLRSNVDKDKMIRRSKLDVRPHECTKKRQALQSAEPGKPWWVSASVDMSTKPTTSTAHNLKLSLHAAAEGRTVSAAVMQVVDTELEPVQPATEEGKPDNDTAPKPNSSEDALEELARHYLDALYLSRTPLAYFVKGPLARARATFVNEPVELISFLRAAMLPAPTADKKYRESVSEIVRGIPLLETPDAKPKTRRKRKWKPKRDKYGLFMDEKDFVEQWWRKDDGQAHPPSSIEPLEERLQRRVQKLRIRETFLQVILILETIALEASAPPVFVPPPDLESQDINSQALESQGNAGAKMRKKKEIDITSLLETLIDRLCIWYSLENSSSLKTRDNQSGTAARDEAQDDLRDFATEVVIPFWSSRIFEHANATSKKLGGPAAPSPIKRKSTSAPRKPGEPAVRQAPEKKPRRPLERASTDTLNRKKVPSLHRSATDQDALAPLIKREQSEQPSLKSIPLAKTKPQARKHTSLLDQAMGGKRQVDFAAMSQASEAKMREKAKRDQYVKEAVNGIRKPNRTLATEETARKADEAFARELAKKKSSNKSQTQRNTAASITATPRHVKATPAPQRRNHAGFNDRSDATSYIPSSSTRLLAQPNFVAGSTPAVPQTGHRPRHNSGIEETPSRGFAKFMPVGLGREPGTLLLESPSVTRAATVAATPPRPLKMPPLAATPTAKPPLATLTTAKSRVEAMVATSPQESLDKRDDSGVAFPDTAANTAQGSIYKDLGWDDNDDYEPLQ